MKISYYVNTGAEISLGASMGMNLVTMCSSSILGHCDMVSGIECFKQWGKIIWDFSNMTMQFQVKGMPLCLK